MFATEENIERLKRAQEMQERLDKLQNCPCLSLAEEEKIKNELKEILENLRKQGKKNAYFGISPENECKHILVEDEPIVKADFNQSSNINLISQLEEEYSFAVKGYKCVNCGGDFVMDKSHKHTYPLDFNVLGQINLGEQIDINQCPTINITSNIKFNCHKPLFKNQNSILYLRAVSHLGEEATSIEILELMERLNADDNKKLDVVYKDVEKQIKDITFGLQKY